MRITFDAPPLNEVALGAVFLPRPDFLVPHFGSFWERIRDRFPKAQHASTIVAPGETPQVDAGFWLPRVWFISADDTWLLQLQQNRLHLNWRQTPQPTFYPRFEAVQSRAVGLWNEFTSYVQGISGVSVVPVAFELTYTNIIHAIGDEGPFELGEYALRDCAWRHDVDMQKPKHFGLSYAFVVPDGVGELAVTVQSGITTDLKKSLLKIDLAVRGTVDADRSLEQWSTAAHDFLVKTFKDLTTPRMHAIWKLRENVGA
jgi:uncharacterized protein (TIGR04255 family)